MMIKKLLSAMVIVPMIANASSAQDAPRPAKVLTVAEQDSQLVRRYPGIVLPSQELELSFRIGGNLVELPIVASQQVSEGDVIAQLDTRDLISQEAQLQSSVDQAQAQLEALLSGARRQEIAALQAAIEATRARYQQAEEQLLRSQQLAERGTISAAALERDAAAFSVVQGELQAQEQELSLALEGARPEEVAGAEAALRGLEAQLQSVKDRIDDATLRAPFDGVVARRDVENFVNIQAGQSVALLQALDVVHIAFDVPGPDVTALTINGPENIRYSILLDALPGQEFPSAETVEFSVQAASGTQTYRGRVAVEVPPQSFVFPGMVGTVIASTDANISDLKIPLSAVSARPDGSAFVWLVDEADQVTQHPVVLGEISGNNVSIVEGLTGGERIVSAGVSALSEGMIVRPVDRIGG